MDKRARQKTGPDATTKIESDHGETFQYQLKLHPSSEGVDLLPKVTEFIGAVGGPVIDGLDRAGVLEEREDVDIDAGDLRDVGSLGDMMDVVDDPGDMVGSFSGDAFEGALRAVSTQLASHGGHEFFLNILRYTKRMRTTEQGLSRDIPEPGGSDDDTGQRAGWAVGRKSQFDEAYAGNYGEMVSAAWWAIRENFGPAIASRLTKVVQS